MAVGVEEMDKRPSPTQCILQIKTNPKIFRSLGKESENSFGPDLERYQTLKQIIINGKLFFFHYEYRL